MTTLLAVVEAGSLSAASRKLGVPLPTVSRRVSELEAHLKTQLLNRSSRRITLTDAAKSYVQACRRILEDVDEAERVVSGEYRAPRGELAVTATMVFGRVHVIPVAAAFLKAYPDILLRLRLNDGICFTGFQDAESWDFPVNSSATSVAIRSRLMVDAAEAAVDAALAGAGIVRLFSYHVADAVKDGKLSILLEAFEPPPIPVNIVYLGGGLQPLKVRAFLDFAAPRLKARLAADLP